MNSFLKFFAFFLILCASTSRQSDVVFANQLVKITDETDKTDSLQPILCREESNLRIFIAESAPWEPDEVRPVSPSYWKGGTSFDPIGMLTSTALTYYSTSISPKSIHRCPFKITCSAFARKAVSKYGFFLGTAIFFDRFLYREHAHAIEYYRKSLTNDGVLKLDDSLYLNF